jgi:transcriptional regulator with XRE-family HTH domain
MPKRTIKDDGPHSVDVHVGKQLRAARMITGVSQDELGGALGITFQQVQKYEKGDNRISPSKLWEASLFLQVPITFFFDGLEVTRGKELSELEMVTEFTSSREGMSIIRAFNELDDETVRAKFIQLLQAMAWAAK